MTPKNQQMYDDFQLVYNNLWSNAAAGLDKFEISMYLTKAYKSFVHSMYSQYEQSELARKALIELIRQVTLSPSNAGNGIKISDNSVFFELPNDILYVVYEAVSIGNTADKCLRNKNLAVIPIAHDDVHQVINNPFRLNERNALRLDITKDGKRLAEIIAKDKHVNSYLLRYVKKPLPIILEDLTGTDNIDGYTLEQECELNTMYFQDIVRSAAKLAYADYKS